MESRTETRFWSKVKKTSGCWLWTAAIKSVRFPYGIFKIKGRTVRAHRYSWQTRRGPIPAHLCVLHRCDTPRCVRPSHLFLGTRNDNIQDCIAKGRFNPGYVSGEEVGTSKLTTKSVKKLRQRRKQGVTITQLGREFGIAPSHAWRIITNQNWRYV